MQIARQTYTSRHNPLIKNVFIQTLSENPRIKLNRRLGRDFIYVLDVWSASTNGWLLLNKLFESVQFNLLIKCFF